MSSSLLSYPPEDPSQAFNQYQAVLQDLNEMHWRDPKLDQFVSDEIAAGNTVTQDFKTHLKSLTTLLQQVEV